MSEKVDKKKNKDTELIHTVYSIDEKLEGMAKGAGSTSGTGGMRTKIEAAKIVMKTGADMVIANGGNIYCIQDILEGKEVGTLFVGHNPEVK